MWLFSEDGADAVTKNSPENVNKLLQGMGVEGQAEIEPGTQCGSDSWNSANTRA